MLIPMRTKQWTVNSGTMLLLLLTSGLSGCINYGAETQGAKAEQFDIEQACLNSAMLEKIMGVHIHRVPNGPQFENGYQFVKATKKRPAYCQVTGSYVTNESSGKTANFLATFPENWNSKYLQLGCSGVCGFLRMNDAAAPPVTITAQGYPGQLIDKGYASFGNDLGHVLDSHLSNDVSWMISKDGDIDEDALTDYLYRADQVLASKGKQMTLAFYGQMTKTTGKIEKSYYSGCSQGGRGALVAATRFPEEFDGVIAGSPAMDLPGLMIQSALTGIVSQLNGLTKLSAKQINWLNSEMYQTCDVKDGVRDELIQNPAACEFDIQADLPLCTSSRNESICFTDEQAQVLTVYFGGLRDSDNVVRLPGLPVVSSQYSFVNPIPSDVPVTAHFRAILKSAQNGQPLFVKSSEEGGQIPVINKDAYAEYKRIMRAGTIDSGDFKNTLSHKTRLLWYHNLSDQILTPYMSVNRYKEIAEQSGGYNELQKSIRLFLLPGTGHCGYGGNGPANFDAIGSLESWVESDLAPDSMVAGALDPEKNNLIKGIVDPSVTVRTMPLCKFPEMAVYNGYGDIRDAEAWTCKSDDRRMLDISASGNRAGVTAQDNAFSNQKK